MTNFDVDKTATAVAHLDAWLETMRGESGYTGPVSHWWESNFLYTGALYDWRYEGIIDGYRELYLRTEQPIFLKRALRAADDILPHSLPDGRLRNSSFQFGAVRGGTPHEAAIDAALLKLVVTLNKLNLRTKSDYFEVVEANLEQYWFGVLWNGRGFQDQPYNPVLVANKHGTLLEALLIYEELTGKDLGQYIQACIKVILASQVAEGPQKGGTVHNGIGHSRLAIPIYTARALNGLLSYYESRRDPEVLSSLRAGTEFVQRLITDWGVAWGVYGSGRLCLNPQFIAGAGDVLRFLYRMHCLELADVEVSVRRLQTLIIEQQQPSGGLPTARGFVKKGLLGESTPELRDVISVVGWVDKSFRALTLLLAHGSPLPTVSLAPYQKTVVWRSRPCTFTETLPEITLADSSGRIFYRWRKGARSPDVYAL